MSVFGASQKKSGAIRAQDCTLSIDGISAGMLAVNANLTFTRAVTMLFEIGSENVYYVDGRAQGQATLTRVVGPAALAGSFVMSLGDICAQHTLQITGKSCQSSGRVSYSCEGAVLLSVSAQVTAQEIVISENLQFMFANLNVK